MGKFTTISSTAFENMQIDAGILLKNFTPATGAFTEADIICATTGGINPSCVPRMSDYGEDVDNVPNDTKEYLRIDGYDCQISTTALDVTAETIKLALGCADIDSTTSAIIPRTEVKDADFTDSWWVGDRADGGYAACCLKNALSTGGFSIQTTKNGKGNVPLTIKGFISVEDPTEVPMEFYAMEPTT